MSVFKQSRFMTEGYHFMFKRSAIQFLTFVQPFKYGELIDLNSRYIGQPNINIVLVDSTSRTNFYYGLMATRRALERIVEHGKQKVFDYRLFQSL